MPCEKKCLHTGAVNSEKKRLMITPSDHSVHVQCDDCFAKELSAGIGSSEQELDRRFEELKRKLKG